MLFLGGCASTKLTIPEYIPVYVEAKPSKLLQIPYPIVLLHGLGQKASVWDKHAIKFYEKDLGLKHAGILKPSKKGIYLDQKGSSSTLDFFTVQFSNPTDSVEGWTKELEQCIAFVREKTGAEKVILRIDRQTLSHEACQRSSCAKTHHHRLPTSRFGFCQGVQLENRCQ